jgi:hypothetical protein
MKGRDLRGDLAVPRRGDNIKVPTKIGSDNVDWINWFRTGAFDRLL